MSRNAVSFQTEKIVHFASFRAQGHGCRGGRPRRRSGLRALRPGQSSEPIKIGFQCHRTGIGAAYGRWYERTTMAAANLINERGGINGRPLEIITEDDGTDPRRGAETVEKFVNQHNVDVVYGTLFSHVVIGSAPTAGELKVPYYVVSEGYHVPSGRMNRWCFQPGITDVRSQMTAVAPWVANNVGKKITMIFPTTPSVTTTATISRRSSRPMAAR
jgi:ABC-type branched-subunit amino acid transport system substrate-binding protein